MTIARSSHAHLVLQETTEKPEGAEPVPESKETTMDADASENAASAVAEDATTEPKGNLQDC